MTAIKCMRLVFSYKSVEVNLGKYTFRLQTYVCNWKLRFWIFVSIIKMTEVHVYQNLCVSEYTTYVLLFLSIFFSLPFSFLWWNFNDYYPIFIRRAAGLASNFVVRGRAEGAKIPEHWCHKLIHISNCEPQKCLQECSKQPYGVGECKDATCFCTFYCKDPPL